MNLCLIITKLLFLPFIYVYSCWDMVSCCNLFRDITMFIFLFLAEVRKSYTYTLEQYASREAFWAILPGGTGIKVKCFPPAFSE